ncbi:hypothetical protein [Paenibacillus gansuensis]|uniref:Uncharacterized protein n=1 Tax=Paenibacillus gansuensis TaxID=306542 RepID=A0ABW5PEU9_9BACL
MNLHELQMLAEVLRSRSGSSVQMRVETEFPQQRLVGGKYQMGSHTVTLYLSSLEEQCRRLFGSLENLPALAAVVCAHELGHAEDPELAELSDRMDSASDVRIRLALALQIEKNAWAFARMLVPEVDPQLMEAMIDESLYMYRENLRQQTA